MERINCERRQMPKKSRRVRHSSGELKVGRAPAPAQEIKLESE